MDMCTKHLLSYYIFYQYHSRYLREVLEKISAIEAYSLDAGTLLKLSNQYVRSCAHGIIHFLVYIAGLYIALHIKRNWGFL